MAGVGSERGSWKRTNMVRLKRGRVNNPFPIISQQEILHRFSSQHPSCITRWDIVLIVLITLDMLCANDRLMT